MEKEALLTQLMEFYTATPTAETVRRIALQMYNEGYKVGKGETQENDDTPDEITDRQFYTFWQLYDKKIALSPCLKVWRRLSKKDRREAILYAPLYVKAQPDKQFRKNPLTFLRQKAWKDELIPSQYATEEQQRRERTDEAERLAQTLAAIGLS